MRKILPSFLAGFLILLTFSTGPSLASREENRGANLSKDYDPESGISGKCLFNDEGWVQCQFFDDDGISTIVIKGGESYSFGCLRAAKLPRLEIDEGETIEMLVADCDENEVPASADRPRVKPKLLGTLKIAG